MVTELVDVNVLVSLAWPTHVHHAAARAWFSAVGKDAWATTPFTETAFVRLTSHPAAVGKDALSPAEAISLLEQMRHVGSHTFLSDDVSLVVGDLVPSARITTHRQVTDAHLIAVARRHNARVATFDAGMAAIAGSDIVTLIPFR